MAPALAIPRRWWLHEDPREGCSRHRVWSGMDRFGAAPRPPVPFAGVWRHAVSGATGTKHVANTPRRVVQPVFPPSPKAAIALANLHLTAKPKRGLSLLSPSSHRAVLLRQSLPQPRPKEKLLPQREARPRRLCSTQHAGSRARRDL